MFSFSISSESRSMERKFTGFLRSSMDALRAEVIKEARELMRLIDGAAVPSTQERGMNAIERDLHRTFKPVQPGFYEHIQQLSAGQVPTQVFQRRKDGSVYVVEWTLMSNDPQAMSAFHRARRVNGTVPLAPSPFNRDLWKEDQRMVVPQDAFDRYLAVVDSRSGIERSGWLPAMRALGIPAPAYVTRHIGTAGSYQDLTSDATNPRVVITNKTPSAGQRALPQTRRERFETSLHNSLQRTARQTQL